MNSSVDMGGKRKRQKTRRLESKVQRVDLHVGQQIRILRIQMGLSQTELGSGSGLSYQQIQKYETGNHCVSASMLYEMARYFAVPAAPFFEGLPVPAVGPLSEAACEVGDHIAYISTTEGQDLIARMLLLSPRVIKQVLSLLGSLIEVQEPRSETR